MKRIKLLLLGFIAGLASSALGIGGGVILVSGLTLLMGYQIKKAIGTSLTVIVPVVFVGVITHYIIQAGNIKLSIALFIIVGSVIGSKLGVDLVNKISSKKLSRLFALLLLFVGLKLTGIIGIPVEPVSTVASGPLLIILGLASGLASALLGIGGGVIMVPVLYLFFGLSMHQTIATSLTVILPTAFVGAILHRKFSNVDTEAIKFLIPAGLAGAVIGAIVANLLPAAVLRIVFGIFMILCSIKFWRRFPSQS